MPAAGTDVPGACWPMSGVSHPIRGVSGLPGSGRRYTGDAVPLPSPRKARCRSGRHRSISGDSKSPDRPELPVGLGGRDFIMSSRPSAAQWPIPASSRIGPTPARCLAPAWRDSAATERSTTLP